MITTSTVEELSSSPLPSRLLDVFKGAFGRNVAKVLAVVRGDFGVMRGCMVVDVARCPDVVAEKVASDVGGTADVGGGGGGGGGVGGGGRRKIGGWCWG